MKGFPLFLDGDSCDSDFVAALRNRNVDVTSVIEVGFEERSDEDQMLWATSAGRVIYTFNARHFCQLHSTFLEAGRDHAGIVIGQQQRFSIGEQLRRMFRILNARSSSEMLEPERRAACPLRRKKWPVNHAESMRMEREK